MVSKTKKLMDEYAEELFDVRFEHIIEYPHLSRRADLSCAMIDQSVIKFICEDYNLTNFLEKNEQAKEILNKKILEAIKLMDKKYYKKLITPPKEKHYQEID